MAGTEYFSETAQPQSHTSFAALTRLSITKHNLLTFNTNQRSSNNSEKLSPLADTNLWTFLLHSSYSSSKIQSHGRQSSADPDFISEKKPSLRSSPAILLSPNSFDSQEPVPEAFLSSCGLNHTKCLFICYFSYKTQKIPFLVF